MSNNESSAKIALRVLELVAQGRIDRTDAMIISAMMEWPAPTLSDIGKRLKLHKSNVHRRRNRLNSILSSG